MPSIKDGIVFVDGKPVAKVIDFDFDVDENSKKNESDVISGRFVGTCKLLGYRQPFPSGK